MKINYRKDGKVTIAFCLGMLAIISLTLNLYFVSDEYSKEISKKECTIKRLQESRQILLEKIKSINSQLLKVHLNILETSIRELRNEKLYAGTSIITWKKLASSYRWVVQNDPQYSWDKKRVNYLLDVQYLSLSRYDQNRIVNELERMLADAKKVAKKRTIQNEKSPREKKIEKPSISTRYLHMTA